MAATAAVPSGAIVHELLTADNYEDWSFRVKTYFQAEGLWKVVESAKEPPRVEDGGDEAEFEEWSKKNGKALHAIHISCGKHMYSFIRGIDTAKAAWNTLQNKSSPAGTGLPKREDPLSMAAPVVPSLIVNELLHKDNYEGWKIRVKTYLEAKGLWSLIEDEEEPPRKSKDKREDWRKRNAEALHAIHLCCGNDAFEAIRDHELAYKAWQALDEFGHSGCSESEEEENEDVETENGSRNAASEGNLHSDHDAKPEEAEEADEPEAVDKGDGEENNSSSKNSDEVNYDDLFRAAKYSNWDFVMKFIQEHPEAVTETSKKDGKKSILHYAVDQMKVDIVYKLMPYFKYEDDLDIWDGGYYTALEYCYRMPDKDELVEIAKCLIHKKQELSSSDCQNILLEAFMKGRPKLAEYLFNITEFEADDPCAAHLISLSFTAKRFDTACKLIKQCPKLAIAEDFSENSPLNELACTPSAFLSGSRLKFWEKWIYHVISIDYTVKSEVGKHKTGDVLKEANVKGKPIPKPHEVSGDIHPEEDGKRIATDALHTVINVPTFEEDKDNKFGVFHSISTIFQGPILKKIYMFLGIYRIYEMKVNHLHVREILGSMCQALRPEDEKDWTEKQRGFVEEAMFQAAERGLVEFLVEILRVNPKLVTIVNEKGQNLFQVAVECRQAGVFNLIHGLTKEYKNDFMGMTDDDENNMLHMMGIFSPLSQTNRIRGAALQMRNELLWFKEVALVASGEDFRAENFTSMTPNEFFSNRHKDLEKEGERSMKDTATACTVVGTLIVTMMFAAVFTLPAPLDESSTPPLLYKKAFRVFIIADIISLFTSTTSVVIFLGILTSRYAKDDFVRSLPLKMILGLLTLFLSVAAMVIVFVCAIFIIMPSNTWIALPATFLAGIPVASFMWMQFPFLVEIFYLTYVEKLFEKKVLLKLDIGKVW